jgi:DNA-binding MarR family transcriptional regulator
MARSMDAETRTGEGDHLALRLWLRLLSCTNLIEAPLRTRLREQFEGSLPRFDLMAQLDRHAGGLKMSELSRRLMVTGGNVTGLTDKLVTEGLVERRDHPEDRRACTVSLTPEGWVVELLGGLTAAQQAQLFELLGRLKGSISPSAE